MAIKVGGTEVISDSRALSNIASVDAATVTALSDAGVGGGGLFTATAHEALTAGDPVYMRNNGEVAKTFDHSLTDSGVNVTHDAVWNGKVIWDSNGSRFLYVTADISGNDFYVQAFTVSDGTVTAGTATLLHADSEAAYNFVEGLIDVGDGIVVVYRTREKVRVSKVEGTGTTVSVGSSVLVETSTSGQEKVFYAVNSSKNMVFVLAQDSSTADCYLYPISISGLTLTKNTGIDTNLAEALGLIYDGGTNTIVALGSASTTAGLKNVYYQPYSISGTTLTYTGSGTFHEYLEYFYWGNSTSPVILNMTQWGNFVEIDDVKYAVRYNDGISNNVAEVELVGYINGSTSSSVNYEPFLVSKTPLGNNIGTVKADEQGVRNFSSELVYCPDSKQLTVILVNKTNADASVAYVVLDMTNAHKPVAIKNQSFSTNSTFRATCAAIRPNNNNKDNLVIKGVDVYTLDIPTDIRCIGIAQETVSASASVDVAITGGVSDVHSGLTAGKPYFASGNTLSQTNAGRQVGYAISATEIVMTGV